MLIPVIVLAVISEKAISITRENAIHSQMTLVNQGKTYMDTIIQNINSTAFQIQQNTDILELQKLTEDREIEDYFYIWKGDQAFQKLFITGYNVQAGIYYSESGILLAPQSTCDDLEAVYGKRYQFGGNTYEEFLERYPLSKYRKTFYVRDTYLWNSRSVSSLLYGRALTTQCRSTLFFLIDDEEIQRGFSSLLEGGSLYILDDQNRLLCTYGEPLAEDFVFPALSPLIVQGQIPEEVFGEGNVATYAISDCGLKYVAVLPQAIVYSEVKYLRYLSAAMNIGSHCGELRTASGLPEQLY